MQLSIGDVIRWDFYPYPKTGNIKARWFIYLGRTSAAATPIFAFLCTTTTQTADFEPGGKRANHDIRRFDVSNFKMFEQACVLDFDEEIHTVPQTAVDSRVGQIEHKGRLDKETMRNVYKRFMKSGTISKRVLADIHESFTRDEITGLKKPK